MKLLKINHPEDKIFISSDLHYNHNKEFVWKARGFESLEAHDKHIEKCIEELPEDSVFIFLGDFALNSTEEKVRNLLSKIKSKRIIYITGNHESIISKIIHQYTNEVHNYLELDINGAPVVCMHYPIQDWNYKSWNSYHLHGHCHMGLKTSHPESLENKILDVGFDYKKAFWTFSEIREVMRKKGNTSVSHH